MGLQVEIESLPPIISVVDHDHYWYLPAREIPGIGTAAAYANLDQFGSLLRIPAPRAGAIIKALFHDVDYEGIAKECWVFRDVVTLAADNAAFSLSDADNILVVDVFNFNYNRDAVNNFVIQTVDTPIFFTAPTGYLYLAFKTTGADNIAVGALPKVSFVLKADRDDGEMS